MDLSIRQGETLVISTTNDDITAQTVQLLVSDQDDQIVINETANFSTTNGVRGAEIVVDPADTDLPASDDTHSYKYMLKVTYADGTVEMQPSVEDCDNCTLPTLKICEALSEGGVS